LGTTSGVHVEKEKDIPWHLHDVDPSHTIKQQSEALRAGKPKTKLAPGAKQFSQMMLNDIKRESILNHKLFMKSGVD